MVNDQSQNSEPDTEVRTQKPAAFTHKRVHIAYTLRSQQHYKLLWRTLYRYTEHNFISRKESVLTGAHGCEHNVIFTYTA